MNKIIEIIKTIQRSFIINLLITGLVIMVLWNYWIADIFNLSMISFLDAIALKAISAILFHTPHIRQQVPDTIVKLKKAEVRKFFKGLSDKEEKDNS